MRVLFSLFAACMLVLAMGTAWADEGSFGTVVCYVTVDPNVLSWLRIPAQSDTRLGTVPVGPFSVQEGTCPSTGDFLAADPDISVSPLMSSVDMGSVQTGQIHGYFPFRVDANCQNLYFQASASYLYKGDDPTTPVVPPIMLDLTPGVVVELSAGGPVGGEDNVLEYTDPCYIDAFPGLVTQTTEFESSQPGHFSQNVLLTITWDQNDYEKPMGQYSGRVRLYCARVPFPDAVESRVVTPAALGLQVLGRNPPDGRARFQLSLPQDGAARISIYDLLGRLRWDGGSFQAAQGITEFGWDRKNNQGQAVARGIYWVRVEALGQRVATRLVLLR